MALGATFTIEVDDDQLTVWTDPGKLRQIVLNLVGNAVKFTSTGQVSATTTTPSGMIVLTVADTGPGIPPRDHHRVFEPFVQGDASTTRAHSGTDLGLAITRNLVELLGGKISLRSAERAGSVFTAELPIVSRDPGG